MRPCPINSDVNVSVSHFVDASMQYDGKEEWATLVGRTAGRGHDLWARVPITTKRRIEPIPGV